MEQDSNELKSSTVLQSKYRILSTLGSGGFGITYLAEHELLGKKVAIKEFYMDGCVRADSGTLTYQSNSKNLFVDFKQRFKTEAQTLARFKDHSIVVVTDIFEENGTSYFVMDYLQGQTLKQYVNVHGNMPVELAVLYIHQLCNALEQVHAQNILHRDIKPDNIILTKDGKTAVLIDFGAARDFISTATKSNTGIHTPGYAPIEQYGSGELDARTDIYGLCATFYLALTGVKPVEAVRRFPKDTLKPAIELNNNIPAWLSEVISKGLAPSMDDRFASAHDMIAALGLKQTNEPSAKAAHQEKTAVANSVPFAEGKTIINTPEKTQFIKEEKTQFVKEEKTEFVPEKKIIEEKAIPAGDKKAIVIESITAKSKSSNNYVLAILIILVIAAFGYFLSNKKKEKIAENTVEAPVVDTIFVAMDSGPIVSKLHKARKVKIESVETKDVIISSSKKIPANIPTSGLLVYYPFNGNADDISGNSNNGIIQEATLKKGKSGIPNTAYYFNGRSNITLSNTPRLPLSGKAD